MNMYSCGVDNESLIRTLLSDQLPSRSASEQTFIQGDRQLLKDTLFNCLVISDEALPFTQLRKISESVRNTYFLESRSSIIYPPKVNDESISYLADFEITKQHILECDNDIPVVRASSSHREASTSITSFECIRDYMINSIESRLEGNTSSRDTDCNHIFHDGLKYLGQVLNDSHVNSVDISKNNIGFDLVFVFAQHLRNSKITFLSVKENNIGCKGINYVESVLGNTQISISKDYEYLNSFVNSCLNSSSDNVKTTTLEPSVNDKVRSDCPEFQAPVAKDTPDLSPLHESLNILASCLLDTKITSINLSNNKLSHDGIVYLASLLKNTQITSIDLSNNDINCESLKVLAPSLLNTKVTSISLSNNKFRYDGFVYLASVLKNTLITSIDLSCNNINCEILKVFALFLSDSKLTALNLSYNKLGYDDIVYLAPVLINTHITSIDLSNNDINCESLKVLAPHLIDTKVTSINLSNNKLGCDGIGYLASVLKNTNITSIDISNNSINWESLRVFAPGLMDSKITSINLSNNKLSHDGILYLASVIKNTQITSIDLSNNDINCKSLEVFAPCLMDSKITSINLSNNKLRHDGIVYIASGLRNSQITSIDLGNSCINCESLKVFATCFLDTNITVLNLSYNELGYDGIACLAFALKSSKVTSIDLSCTSMNCESLNVFAQCLVDTRITTLNLSNNSLQCNSLKNLILCLQNSKITTLDLSYNNICCNVFYLASVLKQTHIASVNLSGNIFQSCNPNNFLRNFDNNESSLDLSKKNLCSISFYHLAHLLRKTKLTTLNLSYNNMDCEDLKCLSEGLLGTEVGYLDVSNNKINCNGIRYLSQVLRHTHISSLNLANNEISIDGLKYLAQGLQGSKIVKLNLSYNPLQYKSIEYLAECLGGTKILELDIRGTKITRKLALQICESIGCHNNSITVLIDFEDDVFSQRINLFRYPGCCIEINQPSLDKEVANLINNAYKNLGIMKLIFDNFYSLISILTGAFDNIRISEIELIKTLLNRKFVSIFKNSNIAEWNGHCALGVTELESPPEECHQWGSYHAYPLKCVPKKKVISLRLQNMATDHFLDLKSALTNSNIMYLDLSNNKFHVQFDYEMKCLIDALKDSKVISLNISYNDIAEDVIALLAEALPQTKLTYIDLRGNNIGYLGYKYIMDVVSKTNICWLSLGDNNIEEEMQKDIELSPYIVPRNDTPKEFHMRYLFKELVSLNTSSNEFEFTIPREDSHLSDSINHYPQLVKMLLDIPNSNVHIYDTSYMKSKRHNINLLNKIDFFIKEIVHRFSSFIGYESPELEQLFRYDSFVELVKKCEILELNDLVQMLLLHRVLYYVDEEKEILHPFIYKVLHKYSMPLFNEDLEPNKKQRILDYYYKHPEIVDAEEVIDMLLSLEPSNKRSRLN